MSFYDAMQQFTKDNPYPFHMPGHKRNKDFMPKELLCFDITEIPNADNLIQANGIIAQLEAELASFNSSNKSYISVNGSTAGILASIMAVCGEGDKILIGRNSHKSAYNALILSGATPIYLYPQITEYGFCGGYDIDSIARAISSEVDIKAIFITSPTYEGYTSDISAIASLAHKNNIILIVDESHGAHFPLSDKFPPSAINCGADISIQSLHKTLPTLGQSSLININSELISHLAVKQKLNMVQTTSPSYMLMSVIAYQLELLKNNPNLVSDYIARLESFRQNVSGLKILELVKNMDIGKLVFNINSNFSGKKLENILRYEYNIQIELGGLRHIIAMTSVADTTEGFLRLEKALKAIDSQSQYIAKNSFNIPMPAIPNIAFTPKEASTKNTTSVHISKAVGLVCGEFITPFPPDVPLIVPGEIITEEILATIKHYKEIGIDIIGLKDDFIKTIEV